MSLNEHASINTAALRGEVQRCHSDFADATLAFVVGMKTRHGTRIILRHTSGQVSRFARLARRMVLDFLMHAGAHSTLRSRVVASREWHEANLGRALCHARLQVDLGTLVAWRRTATTNSTLIGCTRILFFALSIHVAAGTRLTTSKRGSPHAEIGRLLLSDTTLLRLATKEHLLRPAGLHGLIESLTHMYHL